MDSHRSIFGALTGFMLVALAGSWLPANAQQPDPVGQSGSRAGQMSVAIAQGRITGRLRNYPLGAALKELGSRTGITLIPADDLDIRAARVSAELLGVPVDEGLRRLLKNYDAFFYYGVVGNGSSSSLRAVWIYPKGAAAALRPVPPEAWAGNKELQASLADFDPEVRARAYEALMSRPDRESRELVIQALRGASEADNAVRERILSSAFSTGVPLPRDLLMYLVRWDASEGMRLLALDALALEPTLKEAAQAAMTDSSPVVRDRAKEILTELGALTIAK
jgi:hypothetical protein